MNVILFLVAYVIFLPLTVLNFLYVWLWKDGAKGYFRSSAVNLDKFGNREFRSIFNATLRKPNGYEFGNFDETISSVLGKNQRDNTLTTTGKVLAGILDLIDKDHCRKSIREI